MSEETLVAVEQLATGLVQVRITGRATDGEEVTVVEEAETVAEALDWAWIRAADAGLVIPAADHST